MSKKKDLEAGREAARNAHPDDLAIGQTIRQMRMARGDRLWEVAELLNITEADLSKKERGISPLSTRHLRILAKHFGTTTQAIHAIAFGDAAHETSHLLSLLEACPPDRRANVIRFLEAELSVGKRA